MWQGALAAFASLHPRTTLIFNLPAFCYPPYSYQKIKKEKYRRKISTLHSTANASRKSSSCERVTNEARRSCCKMHAMSALWLTKRHRLPWSHFAVFWLFIYLVSFCHWNVVWLCLACADNDGQKWNYPSPSSISTMLFECHVVVLSSNDSRALLLENCSKLIAAI